MRLRQGLVGEEIDGEVVMIDLASGMYYSLRGSSVLVWSRLSAGTSEVGLLDALRTRYDADAGVIEAALDELLGKMRQDGLIADGGAEEPGTPAPRVGDRRAFQPMEYERFDDMAHIIQLDPIHDVDPDRGWPLPVD